MLASLVSWSFSLIFSALLAREVAQRVQGSDYRAIGAAAYLGVGSVWALGLSSSAALIMAAPASLPDAIEQHQRRDSARPDARAVAEPGRRGSAHRRVDGRRVSTRRRAARTRARWRTWASPTRRRRNDIGKRPDARRVARVQPVAHDRRRACSASATSRSRVATSGFGSPARPESLRVPVPDRRHAAALAAEVVRAGDRGVRDAGRRRADPVSDVRGHRADDDGVGARHADLAVLRRPSRRSTRSP